MPICARSARKRGDPKLWSNCFTPAVYRPALISQPCGRPLSTSSRFLRMPKSAMKHPAPPRSPAYSKYAEVYDTIGQRTFGEKIAEATLDLLNFLDAHPVTAIDLA